MKTGDYLGDPTDEMEEYGSGSFIQEFASGGPKNYAFSYFCPSTQKCTTKCKVKGITWNYENSKVLNFITFWDIIFKDATPVQVHNPLKITRKQGGVMVSEPETKEYNDVFK